MVRPRVVETTEGIQGEFDVAAYDGFMRRMRDRGWLETSEILEAGIAEGVALEVGPGPGYLGLNWLSKTENTRLIGLEISENMIAIARRNAQSDALHGRADYVRGDAHKMPFEDGSFDAVFSNGSLHEWASPLTILNEVHRVLKAGGRYCITDLRRDMSPLVKFLMWAFAKPKEMRTGLISSINAAYTRSELTDLLRESQLGSASVRQNLMGLIVMGKKVLG